MRTWIKAIAALLVIALLLFVGWRFTQGLSMLLRGVESAGPAELDPMFAEEADPLPTRPPELDAEVPQPEHPTLDDYVPDVESPVDMTAGELIQRAEEAAKGE